jgi:nucleotide-binding universal stress UspA family protein
MGFQKILVPVDIDGYSDGAVAEAMTLAKLSEGCITVLHVTDKVDSPLAKKAVDKVIADGKEANIRVEPLMLNGSPSEIILEKSKEYDIIVMGTSGKKKILTGSVAKAVIKNSSCPVIVVRSER